MVCPDRDAGNDPEALGLSFHQGPIFINAYPLSHLNIFSFRHLSNHKVIFSSWYVMIQGTGLFQVQYRPCPCMIRTVTFEQARDCDYLQHGTTTLFNPVEHCNNFDTFPQNFLATPLTELVGHHR